MEEKIERTECTVCVQDAEGVHAFLVGWTGPRTCSTEERARQTRTRSQKAEEETVGNAAGRENRKVRGVQRPCTIFSVRMGRGWEGGGDEDGDDDHETYGTGTKREGMERERPRGRKRGRQGEREEEERDVNRMDSGGQRQRCMRTERRRGREREKRQADKPDS